MAHGMWSRLSALGVIATVALTTGEARGGDPAMESYVSEVAQRHPSLRAGALRRDALGHEARAALTWPDPMLGVMVDQVPPNSDPNAEMPMIRYQITQTFPWPGKLGFMREAIEKQRDAAGADLDTRKIDLRLNAERAYVMLWMNGKRREVNRAERAIATTIAQAALGRYGAGLGGHHEVARAQVEVNALDVENLDLEGEHTSVLAMINALRDRPPETAIAEPTDIMPAALPSLEALGDRAIAARPELRGMKAMQQESQAMARLARRMPYPDVMGSLWMNQMIGAPPTMGAMIGFTIPVFSGSQGAQRGAAFDERAQAAVEDATTMRSMIRAEVAEAVVRVQTATRQLDLIENVVLPKAHESFDASLAAYGTGTADIVSLLDSRRQLQQAELARVDAKARRLLAIAELEHAIGGAL